MADNAEFFDILYQQWSKTTGAESTYWMPEYNDGECVPEGRWLLISVNSADDTRKVVGRFYSEADAEFAAGLHGAVPDLVRALHDAHDEADRADSGRDDQANLLAETLLENQALQSQITELERQING